MLSPERDTTGAGQSAATGTNFLTGFWDPRTARVLFTALIFACVLGFLRGARETLTLFLFAVLFAYFVEPLVAKLEKRARGRGSAIAVVYLLLLSLLVIVGMIVGPRIAEEARSLMTSLPTLIDKMGSGQIVSQLGQKHGWTQARQAQLQQFVVSHRGDFLKFGRTVGEKIAAPLQHIWWLIIIPILSLFFLKDGRSIASGLVNLGRSAEEQSTIRGLVDDVNVMLGSYIRAQMILAALTMVAYTVVLSILRAPYALVLGPLAGLAEFVPVVGPAIAAIAVLLIAFIAGYPHVLILLLFLGIWRLLQDYVNAPRVMGKTLEIDPLTQIFGVLAGGEIAGVVGALISVPVIATLRIVLRRIRTARTDEREQSSTGPSTPIPLASQSNLMAEAQK